MENDYPLVITIVGAESSGKTMLAKQLAEALGCDWVPEYAREYLEKLGRPYEFEDLEEIARGQLNLMPFQGIELPSSPLEILLPSLDSTTLTTSLKGVRENFQETSLKNINDLVDKIKSIKKEVVIVDSGMLTIRMWAKIKYGRTIPYVEEIMKNDPTSLYLLCRPKAEWESDPLREAPSIVDRVWIYNQYLKELEGQNLFYKIIVP